MTSNMVQIHSWETAGLGKSPFTVVDLIELPSMSVLSANPILYQSLMKDAQERASFYNVSLGGCYYCGNGLKYNFIVRDSQNKYFVVGSECVKKVDKTKLMSEVDFQMKKLKREKREQQQLLEREERQQKQQLRQIEQSKKEEERQNLLAPYINQLESCTSWLTEVLLEKGGGFCSSISTDLKTQFKPISEYPQKAFYILRDIYGKKNNNRSNSKKYDFLVEEFDSNVESTDEVIRKMVEELDSLGF